MKKAEARKARKVVKPLGDDDLFGDSGDIFSDIPSKPKGTKKKKSATTAPKDDIFAGEAAAGGLSHLFVRVFCLPFHISFTDVLRHGANEGFLAR